MDQVAYKTPNEAILVSVDMTEKVGAADASLASLVCDIDESDGTAADSLDSGLTSSGLTITFLFSGGTDGEDYTLHVKGTANSTAIIAEKVIEIRVRANLVGVL